MRRIKLQLHPEFFRDSVLVMLTKVEDGKTYDGIIEWKEFEESRSSDLEEGKDLTLKLTGDEYAIFVKSLLSQLREMRELNNSPEIQGLERELVATKKHLEDMRTIALVKGQDA